ncbi:MAG: proline hydroxylase [Alphaproteobacteria bacterium]|nr:proline hydroxylase [Alphaproteobacteria bacterium]
MRLTTAQVASYRDRGYLIFPGLFAGAEVALMRAALPALFDERRPENFREKASDEVRSAFAVHERSDVFRRLVRHPRLITPAVQLSDGEPVYVQQVKINVKAAFAGDVWQWHQDFSTHHAEDGVPLPRPINLHVFLDDVTEFNGPLMLIAGSQRTGPIAANLDTTTTSYPLWTLDEATIAKLVANGDIVSAKGPAGTLLIFGDTMVHGSAMNMSPWRRAIFSLIANPVSNAQTTLRRPEWIHHRDFTPIAPLADDCLLALAERPAAIAG